MELPEIILLIIGAGLIAVAWIAWQLHRTQEVYGDDTTQQFKRILEQGEKL